MKFCLPVHEWARRGIDSRKLRLPILAGLNRVASADVAERVALDLQMRELTGTTEAEPGAVLIAARKGPEVREPGPQVISQQPSVHRDLQAKLLEIGRVQRYFAETEYPIEVGRLDVVWRRVVNSVPTYAFEVQVGGDITNALAKLKYAHQIWNSRVFIVARERTDARTEGLVRGPFHELSGVLKCLSHDDVLELHGLKSRLHEVEQSLGLL